MEELTGFYRLLSELIHLNIVQLDWFNAHICLSYSENNIIPQTYHGQQVTAMFVLFYSCNVQQYFMMQTKQLYCKPIVWPVTSQFSKPIKIRQQTYIAVVAAGAVACSPPSCLNLHSLPYEQDPFLDHWVQVLSTLCNSFLRLGWYWLLPWPPPGMPPYCAPMLPYILLAYGLYCCCGSMGIFDMAFSFTPGGTKVSC